MVLEDAGETNARFQPYRVRDCEDGRRPDGRHQPPFRECRCHLWRQESHPGGAEVSGGEGEGVAPPGPGAPQLLGGPGGDRVGRVTQHRNQRHRESHQREGYQAVQALQEEAGRVQDEHAASQRQSQRLEEARGEQDVWKRRLSEQN